jgi:mRNA-degrading endonuclease RelE of RelBE toxin-antitoxin system
MKWFSDFYRIRIWDYRIGFKLEWDKLILLRIRNRNDIYNIFP